MAIRTLEIIRDEHQALAAMLRSLSMLLAHARRHGAMPDFDVLRAMLFYIDEFPERLHHTKESELLFPRLFGKVEVSGGWALRVAAVGCVLWWPVLCAASSRRSHPTNQPGPTNRPGRAGSPAHAHGSAGAGGQRQRQQRRRRSSSSSQRRQWRRCSSSSSHRQRRH